MTAPFEPRGLRWAPLLAGILFFIGAALCNCFLTSAYPLWVVFAAAAIWVAYSTAYGALVEKAGMRPGDRVLISCITSCGKCAACRRGMYSHCADGGWQLGHLIDGTQAEYVRIPHADGSLHAIPARCDKRQRSFAMSHGQASIFLRRALALDAIASGATAGLVIAAAGLLEGLLGLPGALLRGAGLVLIPYVAFVIYAASRQAIPRPAVWAIIAAKRGLTSVTHGEKSFFYSIGLIEGTETILFFAAMCLWPDAYAWLAGLFALLCIWTMIGRLLAAKRMFRA